MSQAGATGALEGSLLSSLHPKEAGIGKRGFRDHRERDQNMGHLEGL